MEIEKLYPGKKFKDGICTHGTWKDLEKCKADSEGYLFYVENNIKYYVIWK